MANRLRRPMNPQMMKQQGTFIPQQGGGPQDQVVARIVIDLLPEGNVRLACLPTNQDRIVLYGLLGIAKELILKGVIFQELKGPPSVMTPVQSPNESEISVPTPEQVQSILNPGPPK